MTRREPYAWDRSGPRDPFVAEMEALLGAFDVRASAAEGVAIADEVAARREPAMPRSRDAFAIGFAAAAAAVLLVLALVAPHSVQPVDPATPGLQMPDMPAPTVQQPQVAIPIEAPALPEDRVAVKDRIVFERSVEADERVVVEEPASLEASIEAEVPRKLSRKPKSRQSAPTPNDDMAPFVAALGKRMPEVDRCVEQARERNPDLRGYFWLAF